MTRLLVAPERENLGAKESIFLAGPITNGPNWQAKAIELLRASNKDIWIFSPRRALAREADFSEEQYNEQVDWEHDHIEHANQYGVMLFWLAAPEVKSAERAYAQTTRFELAEAMMSRIYCASRMVVGIQEGFGNERYIRRTFSKKAPWVKLCTSLEETVRESLALLKN